MDSNVASQKVASQKEPRTQSQKLLNRFGWLSSAGEASIRGIGVVLAPAVSLGVGKPRAEVRNRVYVMMAHLFLGERYGHHGFGNATTRKELPADLMDETGDTLPPYVIRV
jgi:hypothetical protein